MADEPSTDELARDIHFQRSIMVDPSSVTDWFGSLSPEDARRPDMDFIRSENLDPNKIFDEVADKMTYFVDIVADLAIVKFGKGIHSWENEDYLVRHLDDSKGFQACPWQDTSWSSGTETSVTNKRTGASVRINYGTAHMAREHHILEKGEENPYAISVDEFLENFRDLPEYPFEGVRWSERNVTKK